MERKPTEKPQESFSEKSPEAEISPEALLVMEHARAGRLDILRDSFANAAEAIWDRIPGPLKRAGSTALDVTVLGNYKMTVEAIRGETIAGERLTPLDRIMYVSTVGLALLGHAFTAVGAASGNKEYLWLATFSYGTSWATFLGQRSLKTVGIAPLLEASAKFKTFARQNGLERVEACLEAVERLIAKYDPEKFKEIMAKAGEGKEV